MIWLALFLIGVAILVAGVALFAYQEYTDVASNGLYTVSVPSSPYQGAGIALMVVGTAMSAFILIYMIVMRRKAAMMQPPPPPPPERPPPP